MKHLCDECNFLDAHGLDVLTVGCLVCGGGMSEQEDEDALNDAYKSEELGVGE